MQMIVYPAWIHKEMEPNIKIVAKTVCWVMKYAEREVGKVRDELRFIIGSLSLKKDKNNDFVVNE